MSRSLRTVFLGAALAGLNACAAAPRAAAPVAEAPVSPVSAAPVKAAPAPVTDLRLPTAEEIFGPRATALPAPEIAEVGLIVDPWAEERATERAVQQMPVRKLPTSGL